MANPNRQGSGESLSSIKSTLRAYSIPILLLAISIFFQLVVLPRSFPPSYYDVLGIPKYSSVEDVTQAYEDIMSRWNSSDNVPPTVDLIKVQYAFELLTNPLLKRDYDVYTIDEYHHVLEKVKERHLGKHISEVDLPLIKAAPFDPADKDFALIGSENFLSVFEEDKALLIQIISSGSNRCAEFATNWQRINILLDGVANTGVVELGDVQLSAYLAEKKSGGRPFFRNGLPALLAFPPGCKSSSCLHRYEGELSVDAVTDWLATSVLNFPRILYYSKETLVPNFLVKSKPHQVRVIFISKTGERATPFIRSAAVRYSSSATFAFALWKEDESAFWWNLFGVESAPAIVFLKDPGAEPVVYHGSVNSSLFIDIMEKNKHFALPQLRNLTSMELGCDANGYSRRGFDTKIWYCAIVAGRPSQELNKMRQTMLKVQEKLLNAEGTNSADEDPLLSTSAAEALRQRRLSFAWLDGEAQQKYCFFHINSEDSYETCGTQRGIVDTARLFIIRYERNSAADEKVEPVKQKHNVFHALHQTEFDSVSTLVAKYNGSSEISEIVQWISKTIKDGDTREIPPFKTKAPELLPEDGGQVWSQGSKKFISSSGKNLKQRTSSFVSNIDDYLADPRVGPSLLLIALMSFGLIWFNRSKPTQSRNSSESDQPKEEDNEQSRRDRRRRTSRNQLVPPSMTDVEPKDARQMTFSDSDSE